MTDHPLPAMREAHAEAHRAHLNARVRNHRAELVARLTEAEPPAEEPVPPAPIGWVMTYPLWLSLTDRLDASQRERWGIGTGQDPTVLGLRVMFSIAGDPILKGASWRLLLDAPAVVREEVPA